MGASATLLPEALAPCTRVPWEGHAPPTPAGEGY